MSQPAEAIAPIAYYRAELEEFRRGTGNRSRLLKRLSELVALLEIATSVPEPHSPEEVLGAALRIAMGELRATRGAVLVCERDGGLVARVSRGLHGPVPRLAAPKGLAEGPILLLDLPEFAAIRSLGLDLLCPISKAGKTLAFLGLGREAAYQPDDLALLAALSSCTATPLEMSGVHAELTEVNRRLQAKLFQLQNLFDLSRELTSSFDEQAIKNLVATTLMGHLLASRCVLYRAQGEGFVPIHERGARGSHSGQVLRAIDVRHAFEGAPMSVAVEALRPGGLRQRLQADRMTHVVRFLIGGRDQGFFGIGGRRSSAPLAEEDAEFAMTLGRQALAALDAVRMHHMRIEKERQDRELQIARGIQQGLFPQVVPSLPGFEIAAHSESCYEVGGDYYDFLPLEDGRLAFVIADVSGKGTPASLLMASVHASLQALAGSSPPAVLMHRLNRFLYQNTQPNKYVTLFYGELHPGIGRLDYVTAGHVPPFVLPRVGEARRLHAGGPALGLLEDAVFEEGQAELLPGDLLAVVTDGATEALSEAEEEFGDERVVLSLRGASGARAGLDALFDGVRVWTGARGCSDDLTALVLAALPGTHDGPAAG